MEKLLEFHVEVALLFMHTHIAFSLEKVRSFSEPIAGSDQGGNACLCLLLPVLVSQFESETLVSVFVSFLAYF